MSIEANEANLDSIFTAASIYKMPMFQRRFAWSTTQKEENGKRLWRDIDEVYEGQVDKTFLGALVVKIHSTGPLRPDDIEVIDGQQRLTTLYMLMCAIVRYCEKNRLNNIANDFATRYLVITGNSQNPNVPKIKPTLKDTRQFNTTIQEIRSIENPTLSVDSGDGIKLRKMFNFHMKEIESRCKPEGNHVQERLDLLIESIMFNLSFVLIQVPNEYDENKVFETLNERGIPLTAGDLVRNLIFSNVGSDPGIAESIYNNRWIPFESSFTFGDKEAFSGYFYPFGLSVDPSIKKNSLYRILKQKWSGKAASEILDLLSKHVPSYMALVFGLDSISFEVFEDSNLRQRIDRLHRMKVPTSMYPYLFNLLTATENGSDLQETIRCIDIIESVLVRRSFLDIEPTGIHGLFKGMWQTCGERPNPEEMFRILDRTAYFKFPNDADFNIAVIGKGTNFYGRRISKYIVSEYEYHLHTQGDRPSLENVTLEHIIPQTREPGNDYKISDEEYEEWGGSWANICLLSGQANSELQNSNWSIKKPYYVNESIYKSTREVGRDYSEMGLTDLQVRANQLAQFALVRWNRRP